MNKKNKLNRLVSLDVFRGLTIALMIMVNSPGNQYPYAWLEHSAWNGCTLADLVFPFFIVIVGISTVLGLSSLQAQGLSNRCLFHSILRRSLYLFLLGILLNAFPYHFHVETIRIMGVLQRIALCYICAAILFLTTGWRIQFVIVIGLLLGYWVLLSAYLPFGYSGSDPLSPEGNLVGYFDRLLLASSHLYTPTFDPEGLLSTIPAIASVLLGNLIGYRLLLSRTKYQQFYWMWLTGVVLLALGWLWQFVFPLNKSLWSSSYVLWSGAWALLIFAGCYFSIEIKLWRRWAVPFALFGRHALLVYILHVVFLKIQGMVVVTHPSGELMNLRHYMTSILFGSFSPQNASLLYSIFYTALWLVILRYWQSNQKNRALRLSMK